MLTPLKNKLNKACPLAFSYKIRREPELLNIIFRPPIFIESTIRLSMRFNHILIWETDSKELFNGWEPVRLRHTRFNQRLQTELKADANDN